jgi:hypothetical protein
MKLPPVNEHGSSRASMLQYCRNGDTVAALSIKKGITGCIKNRNLGNFFMFFVPKFFSKMTLLGLYGEIDCAHF